MKKGLKWIIIILAILLIGTIIFFIVNQKEKYFNKDITIENVNILNTMEDKVYLDTIIYAGVKSLKIDSLIIVVKELTPKDIKILKFNEDYKLKAHIKGMDNTYIIWLTPNNRESYIKILSHELIHLQQYYLEKLIINQKDIYWEGKKIDMNNYSYKDLPWEIEAFSNQNELEKKMLQILY